jgi:hypothetical protein
MKGKQVSDSLSMNCITETVSLALGEVFVTTLEGQHRGTTSVSAPGEIRLIRFPPNDA